MNAVENRDPVHPPSSCRLVTKQHWSFHSVFHSIRPRRYSRMEPWTALEITKNKDLIGVYPEVTTVQILRFRFKSPVGHAGAEPVA